MLLAVPWSFDATRKGAVGVPDGDRGPRCSSTHQRDAMGTVGVLSGAIGPV